MSTSAQTTTDTSPQVNTSIRGIDYLLGLLESRFPPPAFAYTTDIRPHSIQVGRVVFEGRPSKYFYNPMGTVHGGWLSTLLDTSMGCAIHSTLEAQQIFTTIELKAVFVKAVTEASGTLFCEGKFLHAGKRIAHAEGKIVDAAGNLIAYGSQTCMVMSAEQHTTIPVMKQNIAGDQA